MKMTKNSGKNGNEKTVPIVQNMPLSRMLGSCKDTFCWLIPTGRYYSTTTVGRRCFNTGLWFPGNGIPQDEDGTTARLGFTPFECKEECMKVEDCVGIEYNTDNDWCYLKSAMVQSETTRDEVISWTKECENSSLEYWPALTGYWRMNEAQENSQYHISLILAKCMFASHQRKI